MKVIIGYADGKKQYNNGTTVEGIKVYYVEAIPQLSGRTSYGSYATVAFFLMIDLMDVLRSRERC